MMRTRVCFDIDLMTIGISANPGQTVLLALQITDGYGSRVDGYSAPQVDFILNPALAELAGFPTGMNTISAGVFSYSWAVPTGSTAVGTYLASVTWPDPDNNSILKSELYTIHVSLPFGNLSASPA